MASFAEETTLGQHRHQGSWAITYDDKPESGTHYEVFTCQTCGTVFGLLRSGPAPEEE